MDVIEAARKLGAAIQADEAYKRYIAAKEENDKDEALQELIGEYNLKRMNLNTEMQKPEAEQDPELIQKLDQELQEVYGRVMENPSMKKFGEEKKGIDEIINKANTIVLMCLNGDDPETCEPHTDCGGDCSVCGGCH